MFNKSSIEIYADRDKLREQFLEYLQYYLGLENIDMEQTTYLSYLINVLSALASNLYFYSSSSFRESFLTRAITKEAVLDLSTMLGYQPNLAIPAHSQLLVTIMLDFSDTSSQVTLFIPNQHKYYASGTAFEQQGEIIITLTNLQTPNPVVEIILHSTIGTQIVPFIFSEDMSSFSFNIGVSQKQTLSQEFSIPILQPYEFYTLPLSFENNLVNNSLIINTYPTTDKIIATRWGNPLKNYSGFDSLFLISSDVAGYSYRITADGAKIYFGNGIIGLQPPSEQVLVVQYETTEGATGNVVANSITEYDPLYVEIATSEGSQSLPIQMTVTNIASASGGSSAPTTDEIRLGALNNVSANERLVSGPDFKNIHDIIPTLPIRNATEVLKRSDLKRNEITLFTDLIFDNYLVPTRNLHLNINLSDFETTQKVIYAGNVLPANSDYLALFDMYIDTAKKICTYGYTLDTVTTGITVINTKSYQLNPLSIKFEISKDQITPSKSTATITAFFSTLQEIQSLAFYTCQVTCLYSDFSIKMAVTVTGNFFSATTLLSNLPQDEQAYEFIIFDENKEPLVTFLAQVLVRQNLSAFMQSEVVLTLPTLQIVDSTNNTQIRSLTNDYDAINRLNTTSIAKVYTKSPSKVYKETTDYVKQGDYLIWQKGSGEVPLPGEIYYIDCSFAEPNASSLNATAEIYNVPVIQKTFWDNLANQKDAFVLQVLSKIIQFDITNYRMLTDFVNLKFANTTGVLDNMKYNVVPSYLVVDDVDIDPTKMVSGEKYLITTRKNLWNHKTNFIVSAGKQSTVTSWGIISLVVNNIVNVKSWENNNDHPSNLMIFNGDTMHYLVQEIPLKVNAIVRKDSKKTATEQAIINNVTTALLTNLSTKFGYDHNLYRSEIIDVIMEVEGVAYCELLHPAFDIFFDYNLTEQLTPAQILRYTPQILYMDKSNINLTVMV